ncbi:uncharacterized protein LOC115986314 isoform X2 [Quercus lobata]|uniref:uncharacterized protein LOC115986314 isoform X2 n=1 Tax=Quercus lobata TaxID=97700 RepID=UPI001244BB40|nr:uncharacterized protein LOC115986314 isoform X2 [Quercus lobata]
MDFSLCLHSDILRSGEHIFNWPFQRYRWLSKGDPIALLLCFVFVMKMLKRMIARAARGILIVFQVKRMINPLQIMSLVKYRHYKSPQLEWLFLG